MFTMKCFIQKGIIDMFIKLTKIRWSYDRNLEEEVYIDPMEICSIEKEEMNHTAITMIFLNNGMNYIVKESAEEIIHLIDAF